MFALFLLKLVCTKSEGRTLLTQISLLLGHRLQQLPYVLFALNYYLQQVVWNVTTKLAQPGTLVLAYLVLQCVDVFSHFFYSFLQSNRAVDLRERGCLN